MIEVNFDALCGPTYLFGGLSFGNKASMDNKSSFSRPRQTALEGLKKMRLAALHGSYQAILPPQYRPDYDAIHRLGFLGTHQQALSQCFHEDVHLFTQCCSSSFTWAANCATVTASTDSHDHKVHITPANLLYNFHRSIETKTTADVLRKIFSNDNYFSIHPPLPAACDFLDEGAANQIRFTDGKKGLYLFVYGTSKYGETSSPTHYPARQTLQALQLLARIHKIPKEQIVFAQQHPDAIDHGVFHNDVISTGHEMLFLLHEQTFYKQKEVLQELQKKAKNIFRQELQIVEVPKKELPLQQVVRSYVFNSQILGSSDKKILLAPQICAEIEETRNVLHAWNSHLFQEIVYTDVEESLKDGGGPACLRIRVPLTIQELQSIHQGVLFTETLYKDLFAFIEHAYPETFQLTDLLNANYRKQIQSIHRHILQLLHLS